MTLDEARTLAGYYALRDHLTGRAVLPADSTERIRALFRPFVPLDGLLTPVLGLGEAIAELEARLPLAARVAHLTRVAPAVLCWGQEAQPGVAKEVSHEKIGQT